MDRQHQVTAMFSNKIDKVATRVVVETSNDLIVGDMHMRPRLRLIDELISGEQFLAITNAIVYDKSGRPRFSTRFLSINRDFVIFVAPWEDVDRKPPTNQLEIPALPLNR